MTNTQTELELSTAAYESLIEAQLDALRSDLYESDDSDSLLRPEDVRFTFTKRSMGGYFVEHNDLSLGWVVKSCQDNLWRFMMPCKSSLRGVCVTVGVTRFDACQSAAIEALRFRFEFVSQKLARHADEQRYAKLMSERYAKQMSERHADLYETT